MFLFFILYGKASLYCDKKKSLIKYNLIIFIIIIHNG